MINRIIAYSIAELEKKEVLSQAKNLFKSTVISEEQWSNIGKEFASTLYTPTLFMKILLFVLSLIGMTTILVPIGVVFSGAYDSFGMGGLRVITFLLGGALVFFTELVLIKEKQHYKSGVIEAGIYTGFSFIAFGLLGFETNGMMSYALIGLILATFVAVRYLDLLALLLSFFFFGWMVFQISIEVGGIVESVMPFTFIILFALIYWLSTLLEVKLANVIFETHFTIIKTLSLLLIYLAGNYFVVRQLSVNLMGLELGENSDIPLAFLFYFLTVALPLGYLYWGIKQKSILWIRVSLLVLALSVLTLKYYFSLGHPVVTITISGAILIAIALLLFRYLKTMRNGFTADKLLDDKWGSKNFTAFVASQTLGGTAVNNPSGDATSLNGGSFGGGGAGTSW